MTLKMINENLVVIIDYKASTVVVKQKKMYFILYTY